MSRWSAVSSDDYYDELEGRRYWPREESMNTQSEAAQALPRHVLFATINELQKQLGEAHKENRDLRVELATVTGDASWVEPLERDK